MVALVVAVLVLVLVLVLAAAVVVVVVVVVVKFCSCGLACVGCPLLTHSFRLSHCTTSLICLCDAYL